MRLALGIEYEGSGFCGWQSQANGGGVQDAVEKALGIIANAPVRAHCAGRTDTGVHAAGQVIHFDAPINRPLTAWVRGANAHLPDSVAVCWAREMPAEFHARFSATARAYEYRLLDRATRAARDHGRVGWYHRPLDHGAMLEAARQLLGTHDFSAFRAAECQAKSPVKTLQQLDVERVSDMVIFRLKADGFLHHMVRNIVGGLVSVGNGSKPPDWLGEVLATRDRKHAAPTFSPAGLCFLGADYPEQFGLPKVSLPKVGAGETANRKEE